MAAPTPSPAKPSSLMGVSTIRLLPNRSRRPLRDLVRSVVLGDLFAQEEDVPIPLHFLGERLIQCVPVREFRHAPISPARRRRDVRED